MKNKKKKFSTAEIFRKLTILLAIGFLIVDFSDKDIKSFDVLRMLVYGLAINFVTDLLLSKRR